MYSEGSKAFQDRRINEKTSIISTAIEEMRAEGETITRKTLSERTGIPYTSLFNERLRNVIMAYPEFHTSQKNRESNQTLQEAREEIQRLQALNKKRTEVNAALRKENQELHQDIKTLEDKYKRLLGEYQILAGKKIVSI